MPIVKFLIHKTYSKLYGMCVGKKSGAVTFTTAGNLIEINRFRNDTTCYQLITFELAVGECIIGIRSHDDGKEWLNQ